MHKGFFKTGFLLAALSVAMGAFAAHGLKNYISQNAINTFETAVRYQFYHVFALLLTAILYKDFKYTSILIAGWLFISGIILFCGSLYLLTFIQGMVLPGYKWVGAITPFGGVAFIAGWIFLFAAMFKKN